MGKIATTDWKMVLAIPQNSSILLQNMVWLLLWQCNVECIDQKRFLPQLKILSLICIDKYCLHNTQYLFFNKNHGTGNESLLVGENICNKCMSISIIRALWSEADFWCFGMPYSTAVFPYFEIFPQSYARLPGFLHMT